MPAFNGRHLQQQIRGFLFFIQLHILMYLLFLCRPQQPPPCLQIRLSVHWLGVMFAIGFVSLLAGGLCLVLGLSVGGHVIT